jgi:hypothetical protein
MDPEIATVDVSQGRSFAVELQSDAHLSRDACDPIFCGEPASGLVPQSNFVWAKPPAAGNEPLPASQSVHIPPG